MVWSLEALCLFSLVWIIWVKFLSVAQIIYYTSLLFQAVVDSVLAVRRPGYPIDLFMVEIMEMKHKSETDTQ
jgi:hypothetical protein